MILKKLYKAEATYKFWFSFNDINIYFQNCKIL